MHGVSGKDYAREGGGGIRNNKMATTASWLTMQNKVSFFQVFVLLL